MNAKFGMINVELLNFLMLILSVLIACVLPFETFLFSYAVLGPLHYLTELHWLNKKDFFLPKRKYIFLFITLSVFITVFILISSFNIFVTYRAGISGLLLFFFFLFCAYLLYVSRSMLLKIFLLFLIGFTVFLFFAKSGVFVLLGVFLPTILHVYIFTGLFMLMGYFKSPNNLSLINIVLLFIIPFAIYFIPLENFIFQSKFGAEKIYTSTNFKNINDWFVFLLKIDKEAEKVFFLKAQIFIAFAYTYHYLNWFSKTSVIGWTKTLSLKKMILVLGIWILSIALYLYNYQTGLTVLFLLSMIHVLAEFPLNALSIKTVFQKLTNK
ncbi:hypothetical protein [Chryseobacterium terrae]|uniref:Beta-carotene 15,15'-monooxygenase n=1 Tax=Chryseobacterium terrae TaxID=3163299 RepID=A0ABW8Y007_9FLAO